MVVPDFELICEIMLVAEGFLDARLLARKFITLYTLCKELLSKQVINNITQCCERKESILSSNLTQCSGIAGGGTRSDGSAQLRSMAGQDPLLPGASYGTFLP